MQTLICVLLSLYIAFSPFAQVIYKWQSVYRDNDVAIQMDASKVLVNPKGIGRVTFRWVWTEPHALKKTPGVSYKSRIEVTEIDCARRRFHTTTDVKMFDARGKPIRFDAVVPSARWDDVKPGSIMDKIFEPACSLIASKRP